MPSLQPRASILMSLWFKASDISVVSSSGVGDHVLWLLSIIVAQSQIVLSQAQILGCFVLTAGSCLFLLYSLSLTLHFTE